MILAHLLKGSHVLRSSSGKLVRVNLGHHHCRNKLSYSHFCNNLLVSSGIDQQGNSQVQKLAKTLPKNIVRNEGRKSVIFRTFATGSPFRHDENLHAVRLLYHLPNYKNLLFQLDENISDVDGFLQTHLQQGRAPVSVVKVEHSKTWRDSLQNFIDAAYTSQEARLTVTHPKNEEVVEALLKDLHLFTDEELTHLLYHIRLFAPCPSSRDPAYHKFWQTIDKECLTRSVSWTLDFSFVIADLWYGLGLARLSEFHWNLMKKLFRRCDKLPREHFIRFLFCLNLNRSFPPNFNSYDLEFRLSKIVDDLTVEEVVIIAMAFFKTQTPIRDPEINNKLLKIAMKHADSLDSISVAAIAKIARFCGNIYTVQTILDFQEKFIPELPRLGVTACTHLALAGTNTLSPNKDLIGMVVKRVEENMSDARLKELERLTLAATMFNIENDNFFQLLVQELQKPERADEIRKYGRSLPPILHFLSIKNIFVPDLISTVLSKTFRMTYYGRDKEVFQRELLCLDIAADLEIPDYAGHRLEPKTFNLIMKKNMMWIKPPSKLKVPAYEKFLRVVVGAAGQVLQDPENVYVCNILPQHHTMAIVHCRDKEGNIAKIPQDFIDLQPHEIKKIPLPSDLTYHALIVCGRSFYIYQTKELTGQALLQVRQINKLGFKTNLVFFSDWEMLTVDQDHLKFTKHIERLILDGDEN